MLNILSSSSVVTPTTDRGVKVTESQGVEFTLDYLSVTIWDSFETVLERVAEIFLGVAPGDDVKAHFRLVEGGARGYQELFLADGLAVYGNPRQGGGHVHVELKGSALELVELPDVSRFIKFFSERGSRWHCTRLDLTWDQCPFDVMTVYQAAKRGDIRTSVKRSRGWLEYRVSDPGLPEEQEDTEEGGADECGQTCYIGRKGSSRRLCVYDRRGFTRCEFRVRQEWAKVVGRLLFDRPCEDWSPFCLGVLQDFIAFVDASEDQVISRCSPLRWWSRFVVGCKRACIRLAKAVPSVHSTARVRRRRAITGLVEQAVVYGSEFLISEIWRGVRAIRFNEKSRKRIAVLKGAHEWVVRELGKDAALFSAFPEEAFFRASDVVPRGDVYERAAVWMCEALPVG